LNNVPLGYISSKGEQFQNCLVTKGEHIMQTITFSQKKLKQLKDAYAVAVTEGRDQFTFEGHELLTSYAKYLIEYLTLKLENK